MIASQQELAQMFRDGRGRPEVVKQLVAHYLQSSHVANQQDSVNMRGRWIHFLTRSCQGFGDVLRIQHRDGSETEVELR